MPRYQAEQTEFVYEELNQIPTNGEVPMWYMGAEQDTTAGSCQCWTVPANDISNAVARRKLGLVHAEAEMARHRRPRRDRHEHAEANPEFALSEFEASLLRKNNPWPWVDPSTGATYVLPAKARFDAGTPNAV